MATFSNVAGIGYQNGLEAALQGQGQGQFIPAAAPAPISFTAPQAVQTAPKDGLTWGQLALGACALIGGVAAHKASVTKNILAAAGQDVTGFKMADNMVTYLNPFKWGGHSADMIKANQNGFEILGNNVIKDANGAYVLKNGAAYKPNGCVDVNATAALQGQTAGATHPAVTPPTAAGTHPPSGTGAPAGATPPHSTASGTPATPPAPSGGISPVVPPTVTTKTIIAKAAAKLKSSVETGLTNELQKSTTKAGRKTYRSLINEQSRITTLNGQKISAQANVDGILKGQAQARINQLAQELISTTTDAQRKIELTQEISELRQYLNPNSNIAATLKTKVEGDLRNQIQTASNRKTKNSLTKGDTRLAQLETQINSAQANVDGILKGEALAQMTKIMSDLSSLRAGHPDIKVLNQEMRRLVRYASL